MPTSAWPAPWPPWCRKLPRRVDRVKVDFRAAKEMPMRKSRFTESQIVEILKQGEAGVPIAEILRQHNISKATYFQWRAKYAGASVAELKRLKELEAENAKLKRMYAELALENAAIKDVLSRKP